MCFLRKYINKEVKKIMAELIGQLTPFEVDVYLDNKIKAIDGRVEQLETDAGTNVNGVTFIELKSITTQPVTSELNNLYWNSTDKKIYKKGVSVWGTTDVGEMGAIYKHGTKYYRYKNLGDLGLDATVERELLEIGEPVKYFNDLNASGDTYLENLSVNTIDANKIIANGGVDFKTKKAENLADPTADQDGATKKYVDGLTVPEQVFSDDFPMPCNAEIITFPLVKFSGILFSYVLTFKDGGNDVSVSGIFTMNNNEIKFTFSYYSIAKSAVVIFESYFRIDSEDIKLYNTELTSLAPTITVPVITIKRLIK